MARFGVVGVANSVLDFAVYSALLAISFTPIAANAIGFFCANLQSYLLNSRFTFRSEGAAAPVSLAGYGRFLVAHLMSLAISTLIVILAAPHIGPHFAKIGAMGFTFVWNYAASAIFVFRGERDAHEGGAA